MLSTAHAHHAEVTTLFRRWVRFVLLTGLVAIGAGLMTRSLRAQGAAASAASAGTNHVSFSRQIQPILSEYCYHCHGPDGSTRKPKSDPMRLDRAQFAFRPREGGKPVIIKGDPASSELLKRLRSTDPEDIMPPPSSHKTMKPAEIALVERWIAEGADYEEHWSLVPLKKPAVPTAGTGWARGPIDAFVAARLAENGLTPSPEEEKARLLRRLTFDLTGLPPTRKEVANFLNDRSSSAYEQAVDRLLATDACAEHFARQWLDAVRYADTQGIHHDHYRPIWPYRDWVIASFRTNKPFDQFTIEQIAGDLLPNATLDQKVASGFNRLLPTTGEGGAIPEEYNAIYAKDRVDTTSAVWLGLTTGCASCHDHKFDPITMRDFYSMTAFFRNNTLKALDDPSGRQYPPTVFVPAPGDRVRWPKLQAALATNGAALQARRDVARPDFDRWLASARPERWTVPEAGLVLRLPLTESNNVAHGRMAGRAVVWNGPIGKTNGLFGPAPLITGSGEAVVEANSEAGRGVRLKRDGQFTIGALLKIEGKPNGAVVSRMNAADKFRGWDLFLTDGRPTVHIVDQFPDAALKVTAKDALKAGRWQHVMAVFDGSRAGAAAITIFVDGRRVEVEVNNNSLGSNIVAEVPLRLGGRSDGTNKTAQVVEKGQVYLQDLRIFDRALEPAAIARWGGMALVTEYLSKPIEKRKTNDTEVVLKMYLGGFDRPTLALQKERDRLMTEENTLRERGGTTLIMEEKTDAQPVAYLLMRGNYLNKGDKVGAATLEVLPGMPPDAPRNRLGLARWLMARDNPLPARVTANRVWSYLFGVGLVETTEDFGVMGARPSHRELLNWLASDFLESGWDYRHLVKTIVMSSTYRQSARVTPEKLEKDPLNRLLSRGPRNRLEAEAIRDQALAASGMLVRKQGGPPVKPYQPEGVWEAVAMKDSNTRVYEQDHGEALYRRSIYTMWKRTAPPPNLEIMNAPSREVFCVRRERSNTPLQAFVTMNDPQFVEAARQLAAHALKANKKMSERADTIAWALLGRPFRADELAVIERTLNRSLAEYVAKPAEAKALIRVGESKADPTVRPEELAAWTVVASQVMNLDESLTK